jgi:branched-chain amino acid transport system permease protein
VTEFLNIVVGGLVTGSVYALLAVGFSLVFNVTGVLNLAQGAFVAMGALVMYDFKVDVRLPLGVAFLASVIVMTVAMEIVEWVIIRPAVHQISHTNLLMLMGGMLTAFQGAALLIWGNNPYTLSPFSGTKPIDIKGVYIATQDIWVVATTAVVVTSVWLFLTQTAVGSAFRAVAEQRSAARLMGISVDRTILFAFATSSVLGVIAGAVIMPLTSLDFSSMATYTNLGLIAVTLGGLGTIVGAAVGGIAFGVVEALVAGYVSSLFGTAISLLLLIAMLIFRPQGLLGRSRGGRLDVAETKAGRITEIPRLARKTSLGATLAVVAVMAVLPVALGKSGNMHAVNITGVFCLAIVGLELLTGVAGQVSLGQAGFMAVGGYTSSILIVSHGWPPLAALLAGVVASAVTAAVLALAGTRVTGMYLAIVTLSFGILTQSIASGLTVTGGPSGLAGIPAFSVGGFSFASNDRFYYLIWGLVGVALLLTGNLIRSNRGRLLRSMHADEIGARSLGLNLFSTKIAVFIISAVIASVAGTLYATYFHYYSPDMVGSATSLELITMLVVGGAGTQAGPLIGVALLTFVPQLSQSLQTYSALTDGLLLVLFLRFLPSGLYGGTVLGARNAITRLVGLRSSPDASLPLRSSLPDVAAGSELTGTPEPDAVALGTSHIATSTGLSAPTASRPALEVRELTKTFGGLTAVADVSLVVPEGSISAVIGPNGAGKSTLFNLVSNLYRPDRGQVLLEGETITGLAPNAIAKRGLFRTFQTSRVFSGLTVLENVLVGACRYEKAGYAEQLLWARRARREEGEIFTRARAIMEALELDRWATQPANVLPLAAQKHLDIARALMSKADMLLFDEPGAGMNDTETMALGALLLAVRDAGRTILVVDHNMALVMGIADEVTVMDRGAVIASGSPTSVQANPAVIDAYFGQPQPV